MELYSFITQKVPAGPWENETSISQGVVAWSFVFGWEGSRGFGWCHSLTYLQWPLTGSVASKRKVDTMPTLL